MNATLAININAAMAIAAALMVVGTLNMMTRQTSWAMRLSVLLIFAALLAQGLGVFFGQWQHWADTMLYGGVASLVAACRRTPCAHLPPKVMPRISIGISLSTILFSGVWGWI